MLSNIMCTEVNKLTLFRRSRIALDLSGSLSVNQSGGVLIKQTEKLQHTPQQLQMLHSSSRSHVLVFVS